jgi:hypothetical protein
LVMATLRDADANRNSRQEFDYFPAGNGGKRFEARTLAGLAPPRNGL